MLLNRRKRNLVSIIIFVCIALIGCSGSNQSDTAIQTPDKPIEKPAEPLPVQPSQQPEENQIDEFEVLRQAAVDYVQRPLMLLSTEQVNQVVVDKDPSYQLISTRYEEDYQKGHIEGATWITRTEFAYDDTIDKLDKDKKIVLYCYTASGATYVSAMLNLMGYEAYGMSIGMTEWTANREVAATDRIPVAIEDYPIETSASHLTIEYSLPKLRTGKTTVEEIVHDMGKQYFESGQPRWIGAEAVNEAYDKGQLDRYQLIDVRPYASYENGHVPTAVNIPYEKTMNLEYLQKLPNDKPLIIISEDGQSATQIAALYNFLGYDARTMLYGMMTWSSNPEVIGMPVWEGPNDFSWVGTVTP